MEPENANTSDDGLLIYLSYEELQDNDIQVIACPFSCIQYDICRKVHIQTHTQGTIKLRKSSDKKRYIAMYGVTQEEIENYGDLMNYQKCLLSFEQCLDKISEIKNLKSIAFSKGTFNSVDHIKLLESFAEKVDALVYVYTEKVPPKGKNSKSPEQVHRSFGDLLSQISVWKKEGSGWDVFFQARIKDKTISTLNAFLQEENKTYNIYPAPEEIFNAMILTKLKDLKVLICGQDPYHTSNAAMGLAFSHKDDYGKLQPSLKNIYNELKRTGYKVNEKSGNLERWAKQGVFLINTALTVRQGQANSHKDKWKSFTEHLFKFVNEKVDHCVVLLWGGYAQKYAKYFDSAKHKKLMTSHPCPMSVNNGFSGCNHFNLCNKQLKEWGLKEINWNLV